jgi:antitoxin VapB
MALNIKDPETERLVAEVAELSGESKTGAIREAMRKERDKLAREREPLEERLRKVEAFMEERVWSHIPPEERGQPHMSKEEEEEILGIGPEGF